MSIPTAARDAINGGLVDRYTVVHACSGFMIRTLGKGKIPWWGALGLGIGWELVERPMKDKWPTLFEPYHTQDSAINIVTDVAAVMIGYFIGYLLDRKDGAWL